MTRPIVVSSFKIDPSIRKLENLWPAPRAKIGVVELEVCSICYHLSECYIGYEVYEDYKLAPVR